MTGKDADANSVEEGLKDQVETTTEAVSATAYSPEPEVQIFSGHWFCQMVRHNPWLWALSFLTAAFAMFSFT